MSSPMGYNDPSLYGSTGGNSAYNAWMQRNKFKYTPGSPGLKQLGEHLKFL